MPYQLKLEQFSGPLDKLLELIEEKKLEITRLNLAQVTADFLNYLQTLASAESGILADFLVVASRLLLIKSKALLPNLVLDEEEEQEIKDLEERLKIYQEFKVAISHLKKNWKEAPLVFSRELLASSQSVFYPPRKLKTEDLKNAVDRLFKDLQKFIYETKDFKLEVINLEERMREFLGKLKTAEAAGFGKLTASWPKAEIITYFLVILHLMKDQLVKAEQSERFAEIIIEKI